MAKNFHNTLPTLEQHRLRPSMNVTQQIDETIAEEIRGTMKYYGVDVLIATYHGPQMDNVETIEFTPNGYADKIGQDDFFEDWIDYLEDLLIPNVDADSRGQINLHRENKEEV